MKNDVTKMQKRSKLELILKIFLFILICGYFGFFIYQYVTIDFNFDEKINIFKVVLLLATIILVCITMATSKNVSLFFSIVSYIFIIALIVITIVDACSWSKVEKEPIQEKEEDTPVIKQITCSGVTNLSNNTIVDVDYEDDNIIKLVYTYKLPLEEQDNINQFTNTFDEQYKDFDTIYSEVTINEDITLKLTYNLEKINSQELPNTVESKIKSYSNLQNEELKQMTCKNRD